MKLNRIKFLARALAVIVLCANVRQAIAQPTGQPYRIEPYIAGSEQNGSDPMLSPLPPVQQLAPVQPFAPGQQFGAGQQFATPGNTALPWPGASYNPQAGVNISDPSQAPERLASYPRDATEPLLGVPNNFVLIPEAQQPNMPAQRAGMFQRIAITTTYLPRFDDNNSVGFEDTEVYAVFGVPCPTRDKPLLIEPGTDYWVVDAPGFDLPATLHDDYLEFHWLGKLNECWAADLEVTPGWHSDYHNAQGAQAFRLESHAVVAYNWSSTLKIAVGAAYWGRMNANVVPAGGIIWTPNADSRFELITPKPRIAYRVDCGQNFERWAYIAGEFGGGQWAIQQSSGLDNTLNYSDYRVMLGVEHKSLDLGLNGYAEIGYVFGRQLQYQYVTADQNLPSTMMVRLGLSY